MDEPTVVVTGLGAVTSLGNNLKSTWAGLTEGRSGIGPITLFDPTGFRTGLAAEIRNLPEGLPASLTRRLSRTDIIGLTAAAAIGSGCDMNPRMTGQVDAGTVPGFGIYPKSLLGSSFARPFCDIIFLAAGRWIANDRVVDGVLARCFSITCTSQMRGYISFGLTATAAIRA